MATKKVVVVLKMEAIVWCISVVDTNNSGNATCTQAFAPDILCARAS